MNPVPFFWESSTPWHTVDLLTIGYFIPLNRNSFPSKGKTKTEIIRPRTPSEQEFSTRHLSEVDRHIRSLG